MRLIDADALSDLLVETYEKAPTEKALLFVALLLKNNEQVPTFEKRPRGEWIDHSEDYGYVECPFCHELTSCSDNADELHYCWNCGAEMRKGDKP